MKNDNSNYTLVRPSFNDALSRHMQERGYVCCNLYKGQSNFLWRSLRRVWDKLNLPFVSMFYDKQVLSQENKIIVFEALCTAKYLKWLRKKKPTADIVLWYWNVAKNTLPPDTVDSSWCRKWSFSRLDCQKYNMRFNPLPYFKEIAKPECDKEYDVVFVGKDKGRLDALLEWQQTFRDMGLSTKFIITPTHSYDQHPAYSKAISYLESVQVSAQGRAVLDYIEVTDSGQSLRIIEALFLQEKIITNSELIVDYDFYCPENIFVLGKDDIATLPDFLATPYKPIDEEIIMRYDFDATIRRFFEEDTFADEMMKLL